MKNDPPSGTVVRFVRDVKTVKVKETAKLIRPLAKYVTERPGDEFEVEYNRERMIVQRQDIE